MEEHIRPDTCIFCKIVSGEAPAHKVFEDERLLVFMDIFPVADGHTLVIPKATRPISSKPTRTTSRP